MDSLRRIEDDVRNLGIEAKKKYPAVKEATEKSFQTLKLMRDSYVAEVMRKDTPYINKFRSSDVTSPYYMVCSQTDAPPKLLQMALGGIQLFLDLDCIPPNEAAQVMRIFTIQATAGKSDIQLKVLQMNLQFANLLYHDKVSAQYLTDTILRDMLLVPLQLCDGKSSVSVGHTALATANQIIGLIMNGVCELLQYFPSSSHFSNLIEVNSDHASSSLVLSAQLMVKDLATQSAGKSSCWMKGLNTAQTISLDFLFDIISNWKHLFRYLPLFINVIKDFVCPSINTLLKRLQNDYIQGFSTNNSTNASITAKVMRLSRFILHNFTQEELLDDIELMISLMAQSFHAVDLEELNSEDKPRGIDKVLSRLNIPTNMLKPQALLQQTLSNLNLPNSKSTNSADPPPSSGILSMLRSSSGIMNVHAHPAGACLEAILSYLLTDNLIDRFVQIKDGGLRLANILTVCLSSCASVITESLLCESNVNIFEEAIKDSHQIAIIEGVLSGDEADSEHAMKQLNEHLLSNGTVASHQVVLLSFQIVQVVTRLLAQGALKVIVASQSKTHEHISGKFFLSPELLPPASSSNISHPFLSPDGSENAITAALIQVCELCSEPVINACVTILLSGLESPGIIRRCLSIISEFSFTSGLLGPGLQRHTELGIETLCKFSVPQWGQTEKAVGRGSFSSTGSPAGEPPSDSAALKWRHVQAFVRLVQVVHVLADSISDWDVILDCFEQLCSFILSDNSSKRIEVSADEQEKIVDCINRFKLYTLHVSDDCLVKLMASLVALSLNTLAVSTASSSGTESNIKPSNNSLLSSSTLASVMSMGVTSSSKTSQSQTPNYMAEGVAKGLVGFSMQAAIDVSKINSCRVSSVWQMVMSHLRMVASLKSSTLRVVSVAATFDIIASTLEFLLTQASVAAPETEEFHPFMMSTSRLTDDILYSLVLPQFESCFDPLPYQKLELYNSLKNFSDWPKLTQLDLFSSMKSLSAVRYDDVRKGVLFGLRSLLQGKGGGQIKGVGWVTIIELLILVPSSMKVAVADVISPDGSDDDDSNEMEQEQWPKATLETSFTCMTLIVDDFLEELPDYAILQAIVCLAAFGSQVIDVNISLTAVELLWKVTDHALSTKSGNDSAYTTDPENSSLSKVDILNLTMTHLQTLSKDHRPEIRNCAMRTLFAAIVANCSLLSIESWKFVFDDILFPLFGATVEKSEKASNEQSDAPELKKGVKMTLHHSRDTASKQWAETLSVEVKGFARIFKACTKMLLEEDWFFATWSAAIDIFVTATRTPTLMAEAADRTSEEVSLAGLDSLISLLKTASPSSLQSVAIPKLDVTLADHNSIARAMKVKDMLWQSVWKAICDLAMYDENYFDEFAMKFLVMLSDYYSSESSNEKDSAFSAEAGGNTFKSLLEVVVLLCRPRRKETPMRKPAELQTARTIISFLKSITPTSFPSYYYLVATLAEISFAISPCVVKCPFKRVDIILDPVQSNVRADVGKYLKSIVTFNSANQEVFSIQKCVVESLNFEAKGEHPSTLDAVNLVNLDVVSRRFIVDICESLIHRRISAAQSSIDQVAPASPRPESRRKIFSSKPNSSKFMGGFFSAVGNILLSGDADDENINRTRSNSARIIDFVGKSLHRYSYQLPRAPSIAVNDNWYSFHATYQEIDVLDCVATAVLNCKASDLNVPTMIPVVWSSLMLSVICIGSPWKLTEIDEYERDPKITEEEIEITREKFRSILSHMTAFALQDRFPINALSSLTDMLTIVCRLIVEKLTLLAHPSNMKMQMIFLNLFFENLVDISQSSIAPILCRQKAMIGLIHTVEDMVNKIFQCHTTFGAEALRRDCSKFITLVVSLKCPLDVLPTVDAPIKPGNANLTAWSESCNQIIQFAEESWQINQQVKIHSGSAAEFTIMTNNQILLLAPVAIQILKSETSEGRVDKDMRTAAAAALSAIDMSSLIMALKRVDARISRLEADKEMIDGIKYMNSV